MIGCLNGWILGGWQFGDQLSANDPIYIKGITMTFAGIVIGQIGNLISVRTKKTSIFKARFAWNPWILRAILIQIGILCLLIYVPFFQPIFGTTALDYYDWMYLILIPLIVIAAEELRKFVYRKLSKN